MPQDGVEVGTVFIQSIYAVHIFFARAQLVLHCRKLDELSVAEGLCRGRHTLFLPAVKKEGKAKGTEPAVDLFVCLFCTLCRIVHCRNSPFKNFSLNYITATGRAQVKFLKPA